MNQNFKFNHRPMKNASDIFANAGEEKKTSNKVGRHWRGTTMFKSKLQGEIGKNSGAPLCGGGKAILNRIKADIEQGKKQKEILFIMREMATATGKKVRLKDGKLRVGNVFAAMPPRLKELVN